MNKKAESPHSIKKLASLARAAVLGGTALAGFSYFALPPLLSISYSASVLSATSSPDASVALAPKATHLPTPKPLKAIYMSQCVVGTPSFRDSLVKFVEDTELNAIVIDIKDFSGGIAFQTDNPILAESVSEDCGARDMKKFLEHLHEKEIYVIGRITVFQDPHYTAAHPEQAVQRVSGGVWKDFKGLSFVDVGAKPFWDYIVELGRESYALGFDELNFDYVRFPSDGPMSEARYTYGAGKSKAEALEEFFKYLTENLRPTGAVLSVDLFGMTATNEDDLNIGQVLERALPYFDGVYPMVYPSHYPKTYNGYADVNAHPYDIVKLAMDTAVAREMATSTKIAGLAFSPIASTTPQMYEKPSYHGKVIPWLQGFDYPVDYTPEMLRAQIEATKDAGIESYLFWDAANKYSSLRQVLVPQ